MTECEIINDVNHILAVRFELSPNAITPEADIRKTLDLDSLRALEIMSIIRKRYKLKMDSHHLSGLVTFNDLYEYILNNAEYDEK